MTPKPRFVAGCSLLLAGLAAGPGTPAAATPPARTVTFANVTQPIAMASTPADPDQLYICQRPGVILAANVHTGSVDYDNPVLNITPMVSVSVDNGLLGMAFDPDFATNRFFYVNYNDLAGNIVLARYHIPVGTRVADPASATIIWRYPRPLGHNGGWIGFSPLNNYLYITSGDGDTGGLPDPTNRAQTIVDQKMGKILRIDPSADDFPADPDRNYAIPPTNPFVGLPGDDEIWSYGVRNPWRGSFDRLTGDFYFGDVGADAWEEVNFEPASSTGGRNYGWACMEASACTISVNNCVCGDPALTLPVYEYPHPAGTSVTGGYVYRGSAIPALQGRYFFADLFRSKVWSMIVAPNGAVSEFTDRSAELIPAGASTPINFIATFGEDAHGELYIANLFAGRIFKVVPYPCEPVIDLAPNPQSVREGLTITLRVFGAGADPLTYQWRKDGAPLTDGGRISGATSPTLTITSSAIADSGLYDVVLSSPCGPDAVTPQVLINVFTCSTADINDDGVLTVQDIFDFLAAYFGNLPAGDFNLSGQITVQDIFDFLNAYFAGCN